MPKQIKGTSKQGRPYLQILLDVGPRSRVFSKPFHDAVDQVFPLLRGDAYLFCAVQGLWGLGSEVDLDVWLRDYMKEERKILDYLQRWLDHYGLYHERGQSVQRVANMLKEKIERHERGIQPVAIAVEVSQNKTQRSS